jgi:hypothetical protein
MGSDCEIFNQAPVYLTLSKQIFRAHRKQGFLLRFSVIRGINAGNDLFYRLINSLPTLKKTALVEPLRSVYLKYGPLHNTSLRGREAKTVMFFIIFRAPVNPESLDCFVVNAPRKDVLCKVLKIEASGIIVYLRKAS